MTPHLLDQLASLTSLQDLELLEFSLLKTLHSFIKPKGLTLLHLDSQGRLLMEIAYDGQYTVRRDDLTLPEALRRADDYLVKSGAPQVAIRCDDGVQLLIALVSTRSGRSYVLLTAKAAPSVLNAHVITAVLQIYRNFCSLVNASQMDQLTGLANRKTFDACVSKVFELIPSPVEKKAHERRQDKAIRYWLVMVDIDHFKAVNDRFGHLYGDEVLVLLSRLMQEAFRDDDMIFRFGGEEFVLIIGCPDQASCRVVLERFREQVGSTPFPQVGQVTISLGATQMSRDIFTGTLLDYADQALYHSKNSGRNKTTFFEDMLSSGLAKEEDITPGGVTFF